MRLRPILYTLLALLALPFVAALLLAVALYIPAVQDYAVGVMTEYVGERTGLQLSVGRLRLTFPLDLRIDDVVVLDAASDTLLAARTVVVDTDLTQLLTWSVGLDGVSADDVVADTRDMIAQARVTGRFSRFTFHDDLELLRQHVDIDDLLLSGADVTVHLRDTVVPDDSTSLRWTLTLQHGAISDSRVRVVLPADTTLMAATISSLTADDVTVDLGRQLYNVRACACEARLLYKNDQLAIDEGFSLAADSVSCDAAQGWLALPQLELVAQSEHDTQHSPSSMSLSGRMDFSAFTAGAGGHADIEFSGTLSADDIERALTAVGVSNGSSARRSLAMPQQPLSIRLLASGNIDTLDVEKLSLLLPGSIDLDATAALTQPMDSLQRSATVSLSTRTTSLDWLLQYFAPDAGLRLPHMMITADASLQGQRLGLDARMTEPFDALKAARQGSVHLTVDSLVSNNGLLRYAARGEVQHLDVRHFLPRDSIGVVSATFALSGRGTDLYSTATRIYAEAHVSRLQYGRRIDLSGVALQAHIADGQGRATVNVDNEMLTMRVDAAAMLQRRLSGVTFGVDLTAADLHELGLSSQPLNIAACLHVDGQTNLRDSHIIDGTISDITLMAEDTLFRPEDVELRALLRTDTVHVFATSGDLMLTLSADQGYERLLRQATALSDELQRQWTTRSFELARLRRLLPNAEMHIISGTGNPAHDIAAANGIDFQLANIDIMLSPDDGLNAGGNIYALTTGGVRLDTVAFHAFQDSTAMQIDARVHNGRHNPGFRFDARMEAQLTDTGSVARLRYYDERGRLGVDLGLDAAIVDESLRLRLNPLNPVLAYRTFSVNPDNYFSLHRRNRIAADIRLTGADGTGLALYSTPDDEARQNITLGMKDINLGSLFSVVPYAPRVTGMLEGDIHLLQHDTNLSISADVTASNLTYEQAPLGQLGVQAVYMPNTDGSHFVDGSLLHKGMPVATFGGTLGKAHADGTMSLDVDVALERFPLSLANGFVPDGIATLAGQLMGDIHLSGNTARPLAQGAVLTQDVRVTSNAYSLNLRLADDTLHLEQTRLRMDSLRVYSTGNEPLLVHSTVDFARPDQIAVDMSLAATNYELINARRQTGAVAYGRAYVDCNARLRGTLDNMRLMGNVKVLSATDLTYVLTDSPLSADDPLAGLVEFVDFTDTVRIEAPTERPRPQNINIFMGLQIEDAAQLHCLLSADGTNYVDLEGGGDLTMTYSPERDLQLNGRYTVTSGTLKYTMMVIPLREFVIRSGSYVEFRGPMMNPYLSLSATERVTTTITQNDKPRSVAFDVGMDISQTLDNMGLEFTIEAPEDMTVQNELASMSTEQRGRVAVTMLATGMYITDSGSLTSGGLSTQNALNAFLQSQISNITSKALKTIDLSMGVEQGTSATGATTTDYSFRFAKRFWGNRISVIVGGRVSTGEDATNTGQSLIDNVSIEYRLDKSATRYVTVFYDKDRESLLDGEVMEMGAALVLRRKSNRLGELFLFKSR